MADGFKSLNLNEKIALCASIVSLIISSVSLLESDMTRRLSATTAQRTAETEKANRHLTESLSRPWVVLANVSFARKGPSVIGFSFTFKNTGTSPALNFKMAPIVALDPDRPMDEAFAEAERESMMESAPLPQGESITIQMYVEGVDDARRAHKPIHYGASWRYADVHGNKHHGKQSGHWHEKAGTFTADRSEAE